MAKIKPYTLSGFAELLPEDQRIFEQMKTILLRDYRLFGYTPLDTPVLEASEVLLAKGGGETEKQVYRFTHGDRDMAMRFDLTVPLAKYAALHKNELTFPFRRCQIGKVYRGERAQKGRYREFYQADIDILGDGKLSVTAEAEVPAVIYKVFTDLSVGDFQIHLNNRKLLNGFYAALGLTEKAQDIMRTVDKADKIGAEKVKALLTDDLAVRREDAERIMTFTARSGRAPVVLPALSDLNIPSDLFAEGIADLTAVCSALAAFGVPESAYLIDLSVARGLDYYTGTVYETFLTAHPEIGSVCSGGRYDNLAEYYTDFQLPGVGMSIGLTRLFSVLKEANLTLPAPPAAEVLVIPLTEDLSPALSFAALARSAGVSAAVYCEEKKFKAKLSYADKEKIPYVALFGEEEIAAGEVSVKDMRSGKQQRYAPEDAVRFLAETCGAAVS